MTAARDVLAQQLDLLGRLAGSEDFRQIVRGTIDTPQWRRMTNDDTIYQMPDLLRYHLERARTYRVSEDVVDLTRVAADALEDDDRFDEETVPHPFGFARLERPWRITDVWGKSMVTHVLTWGPLRAVNAERSISRMTTLFAMWNDVDTEPDDYSRRIIRQHGQMFRRSSGRWSLIGCEILAHGAQLGPPSIDPRTIDSLMGEIDLADANRMKPLENSFRFAATLLQLIGEPAVSAERESAPKTTAKRARRTNTTLPDDGEVTVIRLRRPAEGATRRSGGSGRMIEHDHRWVVRPHWHRYRVGPGRAEVRRRWVGIYVKGPADKPLVARPAVYDVRR